MAMIKISQFGGMIPKMSDRILPDSAAVVANNIKLQSGAPAPIKKPGLELELSNVKTLFLARNGVNDSAWFSWPIETDCVRVPLPYDVESRFCWAGDGAPKVAKYSAAVSGGGGVYPYVFYDLGIPVPTAKPTVTPSGGTGGLVTRFYQYTFFSQDGEESGPSPVSVSAIGALDATWAIANMDVSPTSGGTGTATSTTFTNAASAKTWLRVGDQVAFGSAPTTWRTVTALPTASSFSVTGASIVAETTWARRAPWNTSGMTKRLYRTTGTTGFFALVADGISGAATTYNDTITDANILGDELITDGWEPPPVGLTGLCIHSSGALAGFVDSTVHFSEPLQPHAWVSTNTLATSFRGVGIASFGQSVVLATAGSPFVMTGVSPDSMTGDVVAGAYPCLSKRSVVSTGSGVIYSSINGLVMVGDTGVGMYTENLYSRKEWEVLNPETMECAVSSGRVYTKYLNDSGVSIVLVFDGAALTTVETDVVSMFSDVATGELYVGKTGGAYKWDSETELILAGTWRSKEFVFPKPVNLGAAKIDFDLAVSPSEEAAQQAAAAAVTAANAATVASGNLRGGINARAINVRDQNGSDIRPVPEATSNSVTFNLYGGPSSQLLASKVVTDTKVFRLPSGYKHDSFHFEISTKSGVAEVRVAETPSGLANG